MNVTAAQLSDFEFNKYRFWKELGKVTHFVTNAYETLVATVSSNDKVSIFDLYSKKSIRSFALKPLLSSSNPESDFCGVISIRQIEFTKNSNVIMILEQTKNAMIMISIAESSPKVLLMETLPFPVNRIDPDPLSKRGGFASSSDPFYISMNKEFEGGIFIPVPSEDRLNEVRSQMQLEEVRENRKKVVQEFKYLSELCTKEHRVVVITDGDVVLIALFEYEQIKQKANSHLTDCLPMQILASVVLTKSLECQRGWYIKFGNETNHLIIQTRKRGPAVVVLSYNQKEGKLEESEELSFGIPVNNLEIVTPIQFFRSPHFFLDSDKFLIYGLFNKLESSFYLCWLSLNNLEKRIINRVADNPSFNISVINKWESSIVGVDSLESGIAIYEFKSPLYWVGFGFKFSGVSTNEEYVERESEFDSREEIFDIEKKEINMGCKEWTDILAELNGEGPSCERLRKFHSQRLLGIQFD